MTSFICQPLGNHGKCPAHFFEHYGGFQRQDRPLRVNHHINRGLQGRTLKPHRLPQPPFDPVALDRSAQNPSNGKPDARPAFGLRQEKDGHVRAIVSASLFVDALKIRVFQQSRRAGKSCSLLRYGKSFTPARSLGAHNLTILHNS